MIRASIVIVLLALIGLTSLSLVQGSGVSSLSWMGWQAEMGTSTALMAVILLALLLSWSFRMVGYLLDAPKRSARRRVEARRQQADQALANGFAAVASGDGEEASRLARKATMLDPAQPLLVRLLAAQAAEVSKDVSGRQIAYGGMLGFAQLRLAGHKGLMALAIERGDTTLALDHARQAHELDRNAKWPWQSLFEGRLQTADWQGAMSLVDTARQRKILPPVQTDRLMAAILTAEAARLERAGDDRSLAQGLELAQNAAKLSAAFAPGVVVCARLLVRLRKTGRAASLIETAWGQAPHPALWLAWRDLEPGESPSDRSARLRALADRNPDARESRILKLEAALLTQNLEQATQAEANLVNEPLTQRLAALHIRLSSLRGKTDEARAWATRGRVAPLEPDWSDLDPEGLAFNYRDEDWARLTLSYGLGGQLIHPRYERRERGMAELSSQSSTYDVSAPYVGAADAGMGPPLPDDPGVTDDARDNHDDDTDFEAIARLAFVPRDAK
jgi:HemY protein